MKKFNKRLFALIAVYYNIVSSVISIIFLICLLVTFSNLKDFEINLLDNFMTYYAKVLDKSLMFFWAILELLGPLICIRAVVGIYRERPDLIAQYLVWKSILVVTYLMPMIMFFFMDIDLEFICYPLPSLIVNALLLLIVFLFYRTIPDYSSSSDDE